MTDDLPRSRMTKATFKGRMKWAIVVLIPFSVLFAETWLNTQILVKDYKKVELTTECRQLTETLNALKIKQARLENMDRMDVEAPDLGLVAPGPNQIKEICWVNPDINKETDPAPRPQYELAKLSDD